MKIIISKQSFQRLTSYKARFGFTLIELMITISIIGILTAAMLPALASFDRKNKLSVAADQLKSAITEARNYSMAPRFDDRNAKIYAVRIKDLTKNEYSIGYWDIDKAASDDLRDTSPVPTEADWENHWFSIDERKYPSGIGIETTDTCPNLNNGSGPGKPTEFSIGFNVPDGSPIFDTIYNFSNKMADSGCSSSTTDWTGTGLAGEDKGYGFLKMCSTNVASDCKKLSIHSYNGQLIVK